MLFRSLQATPVPVLRAGTVYLRAPRLSDYEAWSALRRESRDFLKPWEPLWPADDLTRAAFRRRLRRYQDDVRSDHGYAFFLFRAEDNALMGGLSLTQVRRGVTQSGTLGYWMGRPYAGSGHMSAGVRALIPFAFDSLHLHRIEAACLPENAASMHLLEKVGFVREGLAREYLCIAGQWRDHVLYALLAGDPRL